jgi:phosphoenolpyruvate carboxykinase (GTP)
MGDYFGHWLSFAKHDHLPRIYHANWFRTNSSGDYLWPGFGENMRVLKWIFERITGEGEGRETPLGTIPTSLDTTGLDVDLEALFAINVDEWRREIDGLRTYFAQFGDRLPQGITDELDALERRLG